jgi:hypothetical protein
LLATADRDARRTTSSSRRASGTRVSSIHPQAGHIWLSHDVELWREVANFLGSLKKGLRTMIEMLESPDDVIAVRISHKITDDALDTILNRLDRIMAEHEKVHVFVETHAINGIELSSLATYWRRALPLFGKLHHFGRVAVVADQAWIRAGTRIESIMLPFISYRTFTPNQRQEAFAWVAGPKRP